MYRLRRVHEYIEGSQSCSGTPLIVWFTKNYSFFSSNIFQDTEIIQRTAKRLYNDGSYDEALKKYVDMMNIIDDVMAPPFQDYCNCQQSIKDCLLEYGNRTEIDWGSELTYLSYIICFQIQIIPF